MSTYKTVEERLEVVVVVYFGQVVSDQQPQGL